MGHDNLKTERDKKMVENKKTMSWIETVAEELRKALPSYDVHLSLKTFNMREIELTDGEFRIQLTQWFNNEKYLVYAHSHILTSNQEFINVIESLPVELLLLNLKFEPITSSQSNMRDILATLREEQFVLMMKEKGVFTPITPVPNDLLNVPFKFWIASAGIDVHFQQKGLKSFHMSLRTKNECQEFIELYHSYQEKTKKLMIECARTCDAFRIEKDIVKEVGIKAYPRHFIQLIPSMAEYESKCVVRQFESEVPWGYLKLGGGSNDLTLKRECVVNIGKDGQFQSNELQVLIKEYSKSKRFERRMS